MSKLKKSPPPQDSEDIGQLYANLIGHMVKVKVPPNFGLTEDDKDSLQDKVIDRHTVLVTTRPQGEDKGFKARFMPKPNIRKSQEPASPPPEHAYPRELAPTPKSTRGKPIVKQFTDEEKLALLKDKETFIFKIATVEKNRSKKTSKTLSSIVFELATPKTPQKPQPAKYETRDAQYDVNDLPLPTPPPTPVIEEPEPPPPPPPTAPRKAKAKKQK